MLTCVVLWQRFKTLRIWITNTVEDQPWQSGRQNESFDFSTNGESSYRVKIEGRLLDDDDDLEKDDDGDKMVTDAPSDNKGQHGAAKKPAGPRFSHFFKSMTVEFDRSKMRNGADIPVEWKKPEKVSNPANPPAAADFDELTFKRHGDENINLTIILERDENPDRFQLSPELSDIVDMTAATRAEVVMGLWEYIKFMGLQEEEEKRHFRCDELLRKVWANMCARELRLQMTDMISSLQVIPRELGLIPELLNYIIPHLRPLSKVELPYTVRVDEEFQKSPQATIYDVRVPVNEPIQARLNQFLQDPQYATMLQQVKGLDEQLAVMIQAVADSKAKHAFLTSLSRDPTNFVRNWLSSQKRDLEVINGEAPRGGGEDASGDEWRKGGKNSVWATQNARESVQFMIRR